MTKEHPFGDWLKKQLNLEIDGYTEANRVVENDGTVSHQVVRRRTGDPRRRNLRIVCKSCNQGWMRDILNDAKPLVEILMNGAPTSLNFWEQTKIKTWFALSAMTGDFVGDGSGAIPQEDRDYIRLNGRPRKIWRTWLGRFKRSQSKLYFRASRLNVSREGEPEIRSPEAHGAIIPNTQTFTMAVGELYITMLRSEFRPLIRGWTYKRSDALIEIGVRGRGAL
ncbi:MAG TPA: hypothetical protein VG309_11710, partial [Rhizomicrobium sp.]|nr:hypothetical protein [Rhizomicrobium sp.]